jgi:hypothetical protein
VYQRQKYSVLVRTVDGTQNGFHLQEFCTVAGIGLYSEFMIQQITILNIYLTVVVQQICLPIAPVIN